MDVYLAYKSFNLFRLSIQKSSLNSFKPAFTKLHPLQAANWCRNSRLAVEEGDLKWVVNGTKNIVIIKNISMKMFLL